MPFVHIQTDAALSREAASQITRTLADHIEAILGKPAGRCMLRLDAACAMKMGDGARGCAFVDLRVQGGIEAEAASRLGSALRAELSVRLAIPVGHVYINVLQMMPGGVEGLIF